MCFHMDHKKKRKAKHLIRAYKELVLKSVRSELKFYSPYHNFEWEPKKTYKTRFGYVGKNAVTKGFHASTLYYPNCVRSTEDIIKDLKRHGEVFVIAQMGIPAESHYYLNIYNNEIVSNRMYLNGVFVVLGKNLSGRDIISLLSIENFVLIITQKLQGDQNE